MTARAVDKGVQAEKLGQDNWERAQGQDSWYKKSLDRTTRTRQPGQDSQNRKVGTG